MGSLYNQVDDALDRNATNAEVLTIIRQPLIDVALGRSALQAVIHPLGFRSIYLEVDGNQSVCIHDWPANPSADVENMLGETHQHSWKLKSRSLRKAIFNTMVNVSIKDRYMHNAEFAVFDTKSKGAFDELVSMDKFAIILDRENTICEEGETYSIEIGDFHESGWEDDAITLVLADNDPEATNFTLSSLYAYRKLPILPFKVYKDSRQRLSQKATAQLGIRVAKLLGIEIPETPETLRLIQEMPQAFLL